MFDAVALNDHLAGVGIFTAGVENAHVREVDRPGAVQAVCLIGHDASSLATPQSVARVFQIEIPRTNSDRSLPHSFAFSIGVQWPQRLRITVLAPPILPASSCATLGGPTASSSPVTIRVGQSISRWSAFSAWPSASHERANP